MIFFSIARSFKYHHWVGRSVGKCHWSVGQWSVVVIKSVTKIGLIVVTEYVDNLMFCGEELNGITEQHCLGTSIYPSCGKVNTHTSASTKLQMNYKISFNKVKTKQFRKISFKDFGN